MGIGSVGYEVNYYGYSNVTQNKTNDVYASNVGSVNEIASSNEQDPLEYYKKLCGEYTDITFRLDDIAEAAKSADTLTLGYGGSMNQMGNNFGTQGKCSISIDISVIKRMQSDPQYEQNVKGLIEDSRRRYSEFQAGALQDGYQYVSVSIEDNNGKPQRGIIQSNYPYSTETEVKSMWSMGEYSNRVVSIIDDIKSEAVDIFFSVYDENRTNMTEETNSNDWEKNLQCKEADESTAKDPVYEVTTTVNGKEVTQKIHINDFKPTNATQAEMCAMFAYYDSINGTEGTYDKFMAYMETGKLHGKWDGNETYDDFISNKYNFRDTFPKVLSDFYRVGLTKDVYTEGLAIHDVIEKDFINKYAAEIGDDLPKYVQENGILMEHKMTASLPDIPQDIAAALSKFFYEDASVVEKYGSDFISDLNIKLEFYIASKIDEDGTRGNIEGMWNSAISVLESLSDELDTFFGDKLGNMDSIKAQAEELKGIFKDAIETLKKAKDETIENSESDNTEEDMLRQMLAEYMASLIEKIRNGTLDQEFQIGSVSLTIEEWEELIDKFDNLEEEMKEAVKAEIEKIKEAERTSSNAKTDEAIDNATVLTSETIKTLFREATDTKPELSYITCFTPEGIICKRTGMEEDEYLWKIDYQDEHDYEKVMDLVNSFPDDWNLRFAPNEKFWKDYLSQRIDKDDFINNLNEYSDKGKLNLLIEKDGNTYINKDAAKYCNYMNNPEDRIYTPQEFTDIIANELRENQRKLVDPEDEEALNNIDEGIKKFKRDMLGAAYGKVFHKDYFSDNYIWRANNDDEIFSIFDRDGELMTTIKYYDLKHKTDDELISEYGFNEELLKTLTYVREFKY